MKREGCKIIYTEEDKKYLVVRKYSKSDKEDVQKKFRKKGNTRRLVFAIILLSLTGCSYIVEQTQFFCYISIFFMIFLAILCEDIDRINKKAALRDYFFEIQIDRKLPVEVSAEGTLTPGSDLTAFYPVEGYDITSGYRSVFYIDRNQYEEAGVGTRVRISTKEPL